MPHPKGRISVDYKMTKGKLGTTIVLPKGMIGIFDYKGVHMNLKEGINKIN
jgi:hypothetical protein